MRRRKPSRFLGTHRAVSRRRRWIWVDLTRYVNDSVTLQDEWGKKVAQLEPATLTISLRQGEFRPRADG